MKILKLVALAVVAVVVPGLLAASVFLISAHSFEAPASAVPRVRGNIASPNPQWSPGPRKSSKPKNKGVGKKASGRCDEANPGCTAGGGDDDSVPVPGDSSGSGSDDSDSNSSGSDDSGSGSDDSGSGSDDSGSGSDDSGSGSDDSGSGSDDSGSDDSDSDNSDEDNSGSGSDDSDDLGSSGGDD